MLCSQKAPLHILNGGLYLCAMKPIFFDLPPEKALYFASDFHLGADAHLSSQKRERLLLQWLEEIRPDAGGLFLVGDVFDFWFEYRKVVPKGFVRFLGRLAELADAGLPIYLWTGNHDLWMWDYLPKELGVRVFTQPVEFKIQEKILFIGHGDGLGPGDQGYKILKRFLFANPFCQWLFRNAFPPDWGVSLARAWSGSRKGNMAVSDEVFKGKEKEWLWQYAKAEQQKKQRDFYVFGHRHLPLELEVPGGAVYYNLGEWLNQYRYGRFFQGQFTLCSYREKAYGME